MAYQKLIQGSCDHGCAARNLIEHCHEALERCSPRTRATSGRATRNPVENMRSRPSSAGRLRRPLLLACLLSALCSLAPAQRVAAASGACRLPAGARALTRVKGGVVYELGVFGYVCSDDTGRTVELDVTEHFEWPGAAFEGPWAALYSTADSAPAALTLYDMRTGRVRFNRSTVNEVVAITIAPDGAIAWIEDQEGFQEPVPQSLYCLREHNHYGTFQLDCSTTMSIGSLRRGGTTLHWRDGSTSRSAPLR